MKVLTQIKNAISNASGKNVFFDLFYISLKYNTASFLGFLLGETNYAKWFYNLYTGKKLDLINPKYFDEKVWWLKLNNRDPLLTVCSDKYAVREYVAENGLADILIPLVDVCEKPSEIDFEKYDGEVIVKCNHNSGGHIFYNEKNPPSNKELKLQLKMIEYIFKRNAYVLSREWNYKNIKKRIVVERVIRDKEGNLPLDYKFMCFDGEPRLLFLDLGVINSNRTYNHNYPRNIYDMEFNLLPVLETRPNAEYQVEKPQNFERMVEIARKLSKPFPFCRVDLYNVDGQVYFGEITFYHGGGCNNIQPEEWDLKIGSWIDLNNPKIVTQKDGKNE